MGDEQKAKALPTTHAPCSYNPGNTGDASSNQQKNKGSDKDEFEELIHCVALQEVNIGDVILLLKVSLLCFFCHHKNARCNGELPYFVNYQIVTMICLIISPGLFVCI